ncbi:pectin lyase-like protein [Coprinellus micaceus]|uniref:galacturonan 1,4-alpha-galacturonidase n=1 Tax=Coprinellus micaceus TaxID=71717 RepID=A0A4Y7SAF7_COPMI|nr:pectin lyase-like protein [Coprinellus micaceus]
MLCSLLFASLLTTSSVLGAVTPRQDASGSEECVVESANDLAVDDSAAILDAFKRCSSNSTIRFNPTNYTVYTPISLTELQNVKVLFYGNWLLPQNVTQVQTAINAAQNPKSTYATPWIYISGSDVEIEGASEQEFGGFYGFGEQWWHTGNRVLRPQLATFNVTNGLLRNLKVIKPIAWGWNLPGQNIRVENHFVDAAPNNATRDDSGSFPFNTLSFISGTRDGFNLSGKNITVDGYYGHNGDDCVSVINGAQDIVAKNGFCGFSSHGLSIGSLGRDGAEHTVKNVLFKNWTMDGAVYGARFKSWTGGRGKAENITWEDITLVNVSTGIFITQNYYDQDKGPRPENTNKSSTAIQTMTFKNFHGSLGNNWTDGTCITQPCWNYVDGLDEPKAVILDLYPGTGRALRLLLAIDTDVRHSSANGISLQDIDIRPSENSSATANVLCDPSALEDGADKVLGFKCQDGQFEQTDVSVSGNGAVQSGNHISLFGGLALGGWVLVSALR